MRNTRACVGLPSLGNSCTAATAYVALGSTMQCLVLCSRPHRFVSPQACEHAREARAAEWGAVADGARDSEQDTSLTSLTPSHLAQTRAPDLAGPWFRTHGPASARPPRRTTTPADASTAGGAGRVVLLHLARAHVALRLERHLPGGGQGHADAHGCPLPLRHGERRLRRLARRRRGFGPLLRRPARYSRDTAKIRSPLAHRDIAETQPRYAPPPPHTQAHTQARTSVRRGPVVCICSSLLVPALVAILVLDSPLALQAALFHTHPPTSPPPRPAHSLAPTRPGPPHPRRPTRGLAFALSRCTSCSASSRAR